MSSDYTIALHVADDAQADLHVDDPQSVGLHVGAEFVHVPGVMQAKTVEVEPDETVQELTVEPDEGYDGLESVDVTVDAISADYVGSNVPRRDSANLTASGATVTAPAGYYESGASKAVATGSVSMKQPTIDKQYGEVRSRANVTAGYVATGGSYSGSALILDKQPAATITPTESQQTAVDQYRWTTGAVTVDAIPSDYVGSGVTQRDSSDLSVSGDTVSVPSGYYAESASATVATGTEGTPTTAKSVSGHTATVTPSVTNTEGYIGGGTHTGAAVTVSASELVSGTKSIAANGTGIDVTDYASVDVAVPIPTPSMQSKSKSYTPSETAQSESVVCDAGYDGLAQVDVSVGAISSTYVGSGITQRTSSDMAASGATVTAPAGYYANAATKTIGSGSATASATKGTVSNHSVDVTPKVTRSAGYITSGSANGTAVTVTAGELVSGSETKTSNGTYDVTNLAELVVNVSGGGGSVQFDTKTATASNYPVSLDFTGMKGQPKAFVVRLNAQVSSSGSTTYYYIVDIAAFGTTTHGNCFRIGSTRRVDNITSGYSWSYTGTTLTITSSAASRSASPGAFYSGSYELLYAY